MHKKMYWNEYLQYSFFFQAKNNNKKLGQTDKICKKYNNDTARVIPIDNYIS